MIRIVKRTSIVIGMICLALIKQPLQAQPPPQGPAVAGPNSPNLSISILETILKNTIQATLDSTNANIQATKGSTGVEAHVGFTWLAYSPYMTPTTLPDRPNQNEVWMSFEVTYNVTGIKYHSIPYFSRTISQEIDMTTTCTNWYTNNGFIKFNFNAQAPVLDDNSFAEDALNFFIGNTLSDFVDAKLRSQLGGAARNISDSATNFKCNCLSLTPQTDGVSNYGDATIDWQYVKPKLVVSSVNVLNTETVTLQSITRLVAHGLGGVIEYQPTEDITLNLYVNQTLKSIHVGNMKENDVYNFTGQSVSFPKPADDGNVVIIADIFQNSYGNIEDTQFGAYAKNVNFGSGAQTLIVTKTYWMTPQSLPGGGISKPTKVVIPAYEIKIQVSVPPFVNRAT